MQHNNSIVNDKDKNDEKDKEIDTKQNLKSTAAVLLATTPKAAYSKSIEEDFRITRELTHKEAQGTFTHRVVIAKKKPRLQPLPTQAPYRERLLAKQEQQKTKYKHDWFIKKSHDILVMLREVVAQEFFRLLLPSHPKTRLITNNNKNYKYIISKEVYGFRPLTDKDIQVLLESYITINRYKYLGEICVISVLLNEADLKLGNIGVDANGNLNKIDGDWCFARLRLDSQQDDAEAQKINHEISEKMNHEIPGDILDMLPIPGKYAPWNWLTAIDQGVYEPNPPIFNHKLSNLPTFRLDVNKALLKILILPDELLYQFVSTYYEMGKGLVDDDVLAKEIELTYQEIITRRDRFKELALTNDSFKEYINSKSASVLTDGYADHVRVFKTTQQSTFLITDLKEKMENQLKGLQAPQDDLDNKPSIKM